VRIGIGIVALLSGLALARPAAADCGISRWIGTSPGVALPETGVLYVFDHSMTYYGGHPYEPWHLASDGSVVWEFDAAGDGVGRIRYWTKDATYIDVSVGEDTWDGGRFPIHRGWHAPVEAPRAVHYWHEQHEWTCSETDLLAVQVDQPTAAFRVRWRGLGQAGEWIVPAKPHTDRAAPEGWWRDVLGIGKPNCARATVEPSDLREGGLIDLVAIRHDGSEVPVGGIGGFVSTRDLATHDFSASVAQPQPPLPAIAPAVATPPGGDRLWLVTVLAPILALLGLAGFLARRRRPIAVVVR
jgi:hypothetical protein